MARLMFVVVCGALCVSGCGQVINGVPGKASPKTVRLLALSSLESDAAGEGMQLRIFVQSEDSYTAARFRFELYEFLPLDANPRGKRVMLWPEIDPGSAGTGNRYWRPHLGAYEFVLPVESRIDMEKAYLAELTAISQDGARRSDILKVKPKQR